MKSLVLTGTKKMEIKEYNKPTPKADEILVHTAYAGICGTDHALYNGLPGSANAVPPIVLGHETQGSLKLLVPMLMVSKSATV